MKNETKFLLGALRRADERFSLIQPGDSIAIGLSGGKDSLALVYALSLYRRFSKKDYTLRAITVSLGLSPFDTTGIENFCQSQGVPFTRVETEIGHIVFDIRKEKNPCALCANLRRGALHRAAQEAGCNKVALGHNREDATETLFMNLLYERRLACFQPKSYLTRTNISLIRPLLYCPEDLLVALAAKGNFPVLSSPCPVNGKTRRQRIKELLAGLEPEFPDINGGILHALDATENYGLWERKS